MIWLMVFSAHFGDHLNVSQKEETVNTKISMNAFKKYVVSLVQAEERLDYKSGQIVFYEGHKSYGVYVLRKGRIRLFQKKDDVEKLIRIVVPTHILGANEVHEGRFFEFGAKAETDVSVSFFGRSIFWEAAVLSGADKIKLGKEGKKKA